MQSGEQDRLSCCVATAASWRMETAKLAVALQMFCSCRNTGHAFLAFKALQAALTS